jgi:outer membrane protein TolC
MEGTMKAIKNTYLIILFVLVSFLFVRDHVSAQDRQEDNASSGDVLLIEDNQIKVPLKSVLMLALKNNLDITFASLQPEMAETDVTREKSAYDTLFSAQYSKYRDNTQVGNALAGSGANAEIFQERFNLDVALKKKFTLGTQAELKLTNQEFQSDLAFLGLNPEYSGELVLSLTQPLLRDFGIEIGKSQIKIASFNLEASENEFRKNVMDILFQVESSYWNLFFRIEDLKSKEKSLKRAENLRREFKIRIDVGTLAPIEIYQAEAEVALRKQDVIVAESAVKAAEDNLKVALNLYEDEKYWNITIIPTDSPVTEKIQPDLSESIKTALEKRPDFKQAELIIKASNIQVKYTKNQRLPRIDLIGSIGSSGLAGRPKDTSGVFGPFFRAAPSPWSGHWDDVYDGIGDKDYYSYMVGIKIEFPLENRLARSQYARAKIQATQAVTSLKNAENLIIKDVRDAIRRLETSLKVIDAAVASLKFSQEKLKAEEKKYKVGMSTAHDVLEFQEELARAESTLTYAQTEYSKSIANLSIAMGVLIEDKGLTL